MARSSVNDISGAASQSCKVTRAIRNVHDQPESLCWWPAVVNLICSVEFKTIPQPRVIDAWHQWRNAGRVVVTRDFLAIFGHLACVLSDWLLFKMQAHWFINVIFCFPLLLCKVRWYSGEEKYAGCYRSGVLSPLRWGLPPGFQESNELHCFSWWDRGRVWESIWKKGALLLAGITV